MAIKKVTKKVVPKKTVVKPLVKKDTSKNKVIKPKAKSKVVKGTNKKDLVVANNQTSFWVSDGKILNSLVALKDALSEMEKEVYLYHAGGNHNDFSNWIAAVLSDIECAEAIEKATSPKTARSIIVKHLKNYQI